MVDIAKLGFDIDSRSARRAGRDLDDLTRRARPAERAVKGVGSASATAGVGMSKLGASIVRTITAIVGVTAAMALARKSITKGLSFDAALGEASTLIEGTVEQMEFLSASARDMAKQFGTTGVEQVDAFYQAISAGSETVQEAAELLEIANKLAIGGVTDTKTAVDVLTTVINSYGKENITAMQAADILFAGVKAGKTTIDELGNALGRVTSIASIAGLKFFELTAAVATLTAGGISTNEAIIGMKAIINGLISPTEEARKLAIKLGLEFNITALRTKGLGDFLEDLADKTQGSIEALSELFSAQEARGPILALVGSGAEKLAKTLDATKNSAGDATTAFEKMAERLSKRLDVQMSIISGQVLALGTLLLTVMVPSLEFATEHAGLLGAALAILAATQIPRLILMLGTLAAAARASGAALIILGGVPGLIAAGVAALVIGLGFLIGVFDKTVDASEKLRKITDGLIDSLKEEKTQAEALTGILDSGQAISAEVAKQKLVEARTRLTNVDAIIAEQQAVTLGSAAFREANEEFQKQQRLLDKLSERNSDFLMLEQSSIDPQKARRDAALEARNALLLVDARLTNQNADILANIIALEKIIDAGGRAGTKPKTLVTTTGEGEEKTPFQEIIAGLEKQINLIEERTLAFELDSAALAENIALSEAFNAANEASLDLTIDQKNEIRDYAKEIGEATRRLEEMAEASEKAAEETRLLKKATEAEAERKKRELKDIAADIIDPFKDALKEGEADFQSFADTLINIASRLRDRLIDELFKPIEDELFRLLSGAAQGQGNGGILGIATSIVGLVVGGVGTAGAVGGVAGTPGVTSGIGNPSAVPSFSQFTHGGISDVPAVFGEDGPEAAVPLPDGRRIPVDLRLERPEPQREQVSAPVNTFFIDASGADPAAIARLEAVLVETVGPGKIERRAVAAVILARRRNPRLF